MGEKGENPDELFRKGRKEKKKNKGIKWTLMGKIPAMKEPFKAAEKQEL